MWRSNLWDLKRESRLLRRWSEVSEHVENRASSFQGVATMAHSLGLKLARISGHWKRRYGWHHVETRTLKFKVALQQSRILGPQNHNLSACDDLHP